MGLAMQKRRNGWFAAYTTMYIICVAACLCLFYIRGKLPIYKVDGYMQHYTVLGHMREVVRDLLAGNGFRMIDFRLGQGMDTLTTMGYHGFTDPLNLIAALFPEQHTHCAYMLISFLRVYFTGISLVFYARKIGARDGWALSCAGIIYAFSGYAAYNMSCHTYFLNAMILLPMLFVMVERVFRREGWAGFALVVALTLAVNFYFGYVNTLIAIAYIVVRLIARAGESGIRGTARDGFALLGAYVLGAAISAVVFLPEVLAYFNNVRMGETGGYHGSMLRYPAKYYIRFLCNLFMPWGMAPHWTILSFAPLAFAGVIALLWKRGRRKVQLMAGMGLCAAALCVPLLGKILCGGSYLNNRWSYALNVFIAAAAALALPGLLAPKRRAMRRVIGLSMLAWCGGLLAYCAVNGMISPMRMLGIASMLATGLLILLYNSRRAAWLRAGNMGRALCALLVLSVPVNVASMYAYIGFFGEMMPWNIQEKYANETAADRIEDDGVYRVEQLAYGDSHALMKDYMGTGFFWSLVPAEVGNYYCDLGSSAQRFLDSVLDLGGGAAAETVAAVKYCIAPEAAAINAVPYGFEFSRSVASGKGRRFDVYENRYALPIGYAYDAAMTEAAYDALTVDQKQQALLACAICDTDLLPQADFADEGISLEYSVLESSDVEWGDRGFSAGNGDTLQLGFAAPEDSETWLVFDGLITGKPARFTVESRRGTTYAITSSPSSLYYFASPAIAICLGGGEEALEGCTVRFYKGSTFRFDGLRVVSLPLARYRERAAARRSEAMTDVALGTNRLTGRIDVPGDRVLQIAVPYSRGWRAWVDGVQQPVLRCGGMYMGLEIGAGRHEIEMRYVTPGLKIGAAITAAGLALMLALAMAGRRMRRKRIQARGEDRT